MIWCDLTRKCVRSCSLWTQKWICQFLFPSGLTRFFHNGQDLQRHAVSLIISKIRSILHWFESQTQLHFYASSLLLVYEGSPRTVNGRKHKRAEIGREHQQGEPQSNCNKPHEALSVQGSLTHSHPYCHERNTNGICVGSVEVEHEEIGMWDKKQFGQEEAVEVKMIDFAHVFSSNSPDEGYMFGLRNLLSTLEQILKDWHLTSWESPSLSLPLSLSLIWYFSVVLN